MRLVASSLAAAAFVLTVDPTAARACSAPTCWGGTITPNEPTPVPANLPGIYWKPNFGANGTGEADPANVMLTTAAAPDTEIPFTTTALADGAVLIVPSTPLAESTTYVVKDLNTCGGSGTGPSASFVVGAQAPLPTVLGSLSVTSDAIEKIEVASFSGSCSAEVTAHRVTITPSLIAEAIPWTSAFHFDVLVDGQVWRQTASINTYPDVRGTWTLFRTCEATDPGASPGLDEGPHTVSVRATIPGTSMTLTTDELSVDMHCPGESGGTDVDESMGGCQSTPAGGPAWFAIAVVGLLLRTCRPARAHRRRDARPARR